MDPLIIQGSFKLYCINKVNEFSIINIKRINTKEIIVLYLKFYIFIFFNICIIYIFYQFYRLFIYLFYDVY